MSLVSNKGIPLEVIVSEPVHNCNKITQRVEFVDNKPTDNILGHVYLATNTDTYDQYSVFVEGRKPVIDPEKLAEIQAAGNKVFIAFENAIIKPYYSDKTKRIEDSVKADSVQIVETV